MAHYIDDNSIEFNIVDEAGVALWIDENSIYLGGEPTADASNTRYIAFNMSVALLAALLPLF